MKSFRPEVELPAASSWGDFNHSSDKNELLDKPTPAKSSIMVEPYAERLAAAMKHAGLKTQKLADQLGVSYQAIKKALDGKTKSLSAENSSRVAVMTGVSAHWLATGEGEMLPTDGVVEASNVTALPAPPMRGFAGALTEVQAAMDGLSPLLQVAAKAVMHQWIDGQASLPDVVATIEGMRQISVGSAPATEKRAA